MTGDQSTQDEDHYAGQVAELTAFQRLVTLFSRAKDIGRDPNVSGAEWATASELAHQALSIVGVPEPDHQRFTGVQVDPGVAAVARARQRAHQAYESAAPGAAAAGQFATGPLHMEGQGTLTAAEVRAGAQPAPAAEMGPGPVREDFEWSQAGWDTYSAALQAWETTRYQQAVAAAAVRAGVEPSPAAVVLAESLAALAGEHLGAEWYPVEQVPSAFRVVDSGGTGGPTLIVHVMEVNR
jgi:hypothetical protein